MRRVVGGVLVGVIGAAAGYWFARPAPPPAEVVAEGELAGQPALERPPGAEVYASPQQPGLVVRVRQGTAPAPQVLVELVRETRALGVSRLEWLPVARERTDAQGRALFPVLAGAYLAQATAADGASAQARFDVPVAGVAAELELTLEASVPVEGRVIDAATKQPIAQAQVALDPLEPTDVETPALGGLGARSDSLGRFAASAPKGRWRARASAPGYLDEVLGVTAPAREVVVELTRGSGLSGRVLDARGQPVWGALVRAGPSSTSPVRVEEDGRFTLTAAPGPVTLFALAPDGRQGLQRVTLPPGQLEVTVTVAEGATLTGQVKDALGQGVAKAEVLLLAEPDEVEVARMETAAEGRFEARHLPPGRYSVAAQRGPGQRAAAIGVEVPRAQPLELVLGDTGRLTGLVTDGAGQPLAHARVTAEWAPGLHEVRRSTRSDATGRFSFDELPPAELSVQALVHDERSDERTVYVGSGAVTEVTLAVVPLGRLVVMVSNPKVTRVMVSSTSGGGRRRPSGDVVDGRFEAQLPAGTYRLFGAAGTPAEGFQFVEAATVEVKAGEVTTTTLADLAALSRPQSAADPRMHPELGSGVSFENVAGGVRIDFLMADCPAAKAGARVGDLVVAIDGAPPRDARDAFDQLRKPAGQAVVLLVRRDSQDLALTVR